MSHICHFLFFSCIYDLFFGFIPTPQTPLQGSVYMCVHRWVEGWVHVCMCVCAHMCTHAQCMHMCEYFKNIILYMYAHATNMGVAFCCKPPGAKKVHHYYSHKLFPTFLQIRVWTDQDLHEQKPTTILTNHTALHSEKRTYTQMSWIIAMNIQVNCRCCFL